MGCAVFLLAAAPASVVAKNQLIWIQDDLKAALRDRLTDLKPAYADKLDIRIEDDTVRLDGKLAHGWERAQVIQAVGSMEPVDRVVNRIDVRASASNSQRAFDPETVEARVERRLNLDPDQLGLVLSGGVVRLDGIVTDRDLPDEITQLLRKNFGIGHISNAVTWVERLPAGYNRPDNRYDDT